MRLRDWAEQQGIHYLTAWKWFRDGKLPVPAVQTPSGTILVQPHTGPQPGGGLGLYAWVASHDQRADLDRQLARLTQVEATLAAHDWRLVVLDGGEVTDDLIGDMVEVLTSFCAGLYGRRSARNRAEKALRCAQRDVGPAGAARGDGVAG